MKNIALVFILISPFLGFSQTKMEQNTLVIRDTITRAKLSQVKLLSELISDIPTSYSVIISQITYKVGGIVKMSQVTGMELGTSLMKDLAKTSKGSKIFLDLKIHDQKKSTSKTYVYYVKE